MSDGRALRSSPELEDPGSARFAIGACAFASGPALPLQSATAIRVWWMALERWPASTLARGGVDEAHPVGSRSLRVRRSPVSALSQAGLGPVRLGGHFGTHAELRCCCYRD